MKDKLYIDFDEESSKEYIENNKQYLSDSDYWLYDLLKTNQKMFVIPDFIAISILCKAILLRKTTQRLNRKLQKANTKLKKIRRINSIPSYTPKETLTVQWYGGGGGDYKKFNKR